MWYGLPALSWRWYAAYVRTTIAWARSASVGHVSDASALSAPATYSSSGSSFTTARPPPFFRISSVPPYSRPLSRIVPSLESRAPRPNGAPSISTPPSRETARITPPPPTCIGSPQRGHLATALMSTSSPRSSTVRAFSSTATRMVGPGDTARAEAASISPEAIGSTATTRRLIGGSTARRSG